MKVYLAIHFVHCLITGGERGEREGKRQMKKVKVALAQPVFPLYLPPSSGDQVHPISGLFHWHCRCIVEIG
jgi:hypothetical protein